MSTALSLNALSALLIGEESVGRNGLRNARRCVNNRRAVLVFAEAIELDLDRRSFPKRFRALFGIAHLRSAASEADLHLFTSRTFADETAFKVHHQTGETFGQRLEMSIKQVVQMGYDEIVLVGRDCPRLTSRDVSNAFDLLSNHRLVLGPDHRGGCYLIAFRAADALLLKNVRWQANRDFAELRDRAGAVATAVLSTKLDLDTWRDLFLFALRDGSWLRSFWRWLEEHSYPSKLSFAPRVDAWRKHQRVTWQLPPPAVA